MRRLVAVALGASVACHDGPMAKIDRLRDALVSDDAAKIAAATVGPTCAEQPPVVVAGERPGPYDAGCLAQIANALGSKSGFSSENFDHASAAAAAEVLVREGRGDVLAHADRWLSDVKTSRGAGHDALRLAMARKMAEAAPLVGRPIEDDATAAATLKAIAAAIPGACPTYSLVGTGAKGIAPEQDPEHSACVFRDLSRREGPGGRYGVGTFRALEGSLALWREAERALRLGVGVVTDAGAKATLEKKLGLIEQATQKIATKKVDSPSAENAAFLGFVHEDAGIPLFRVKDGGADANLR